MKKTLIIAIATSAAAISGVSAQTHLVAGWDFSQYLGDSFSTVTADATPVNTLSANYSSFDPTFGAGAESAAFGTLYYNGQFGSDLQNTSFSANDAIRPTSLNLIPNNPAFGQDFNLNTVQTAEGADFAQPYSLQLGNSTAGTGFNIVFEATAASVQTDWVFTFAGLRGIGTDIVSVEFSTDATTWGTAETYTLTDVEAAFSTTVKDVISDTAYFRVSSDGYSAIDNVAIGAVPEPSTFAALAGVVVLGFAAARRRRRA